MGAMPSLRPLCHVDSYTYGIFYGFCQPLIEAIYLYNHFSWLGFLHSTVSAPVTQIDRVIDVQNDSKTVAGSLWKNIRFQLTSWIIDIIVWYHGRVSLCTILHSTFIPHNENSQGERYPPSHLMLLMLPLTFGVETGTVTIPNLPNQEA